MNHFKTTYFFGTAEFRDFTRFWGTVYFNGFTQFWATVAFDGVAEFWNYTYFNSFTWLRDHVRIGNSFLDNIFLDTDSGKIIAKEFTETGP